MFGAAQGLNYIHTFPARPVLVHANVKPSNNLLDERGGACVSECGLMRTEEERSRARPPPRRERGAAAREREVEERGAEQRRVSERLRRAVQEVTLTEAPEEGPPPTFFARQAKDVRMAPRSQANSWLHATNVLFAWLIRHV